MGKDYLSRKKHQQDRNQQYAALWLGAQLEREQDQYYLGSAKVPVDVLTFDPLAPRDIDERNVRRLLSSLKLSGPFQLDPSHHVPAIITRVEFADAVSRAGSTAQVTRERDSSQWPLLLFKAGFQLQCLRGKHRIEVARQYLLGRNRWWIVDFYAEDLSTELQSHLIYKTSNEQPPSAGEIYFRILQADHGVGEDIDGWWAQIQSVNQRTELQRLFARPTLQASFRALAQMPACGRGMLAGYVGTLLRLKCDEEIDHYLQHIYKAWSLILDSNREWMSKLDVETIACLDSRIPARSRSDAAYVRPLIMRGSIFQSFTQPERDHIWRNLLRYPYRIPSLRLFFKDLLYFEMLANCVKKLVKPVRQQSVLKALQQAYVGVQEMHPDSDSPSFRNSYKSLYLSAMRHLEALRPGSVLLEAGDTRIVVGENRQAWSAFAEDAHRLGFRSEAIDAARAAHPDRLAARALLLQVRHPMDFVYEESELESSISEMVAIFDRAKRVAAVKDRPLLVCEGKGEPVERRYGRPFKKAYETTARHLTFHHMQLPNDDTGQGITAFFIRRDVYLSFFGPCDVVDALTEDDMSVCDSVPDSPSTDSHRLFYSSPGSDVSSNRGSNAIDVDSDDSGGTDRPDSLSQYSQPSVDSRLHTESPLGDNPFDQSERETSEVTDAQTAPRHGVRLVLTSLAGPKPEIVEDKIMADAAAAEYVIGQYLTRGMFLFDSDLRSLAPSQCWDAMLEGECIYLIPENRSTFSAAAVLDPSSLKRVASTELINPRPRKFYETDW